MTPANLPPELETFLSGGPSIPQSVQATIVYGWWKMLPIGRLRLLQRLEREKSPVLRVLIADLAAARALLDVAEKPARDMADTLLLMGIKKIPTANGRSNPGLVRSLETLGSGPGRMELEGGILPA